MAEHRVVIIGNGVAGATAALTLRRLRPRWQIVMISGESDHFYSRPALMYIYMGHLRYEDTKPHEDHDWDRQRIERVRGWVVGIDTRNQRVVLDDGAMHAYDSLLLATGSHSNRFGWPGQDLDRVHGFYGLGDLASLEQATPDLRHAVIVGGGLIGIELAEMLHTRGIGVTILVREMSYWNNVMPNAESALLNRVIRAEGFDLRLGSELREILDDGQGGAAGVVTKDGERIACQFVGLTAGVRPNLSALAESDIPTERGVVVDEQLRSTAPNVFAAGDCAEIVQADGQHRIWPVWYTGRAQGEVAARVMTGEDLRYDPGIWFNSAKFLDLEWQTYGEVTCGEREDEDGKPRCLLWEDPAQRLSVRLATRDGILVGVNTLGIRYRHKVCERWIADRTPVGEVLDHLGEANFDPEFFDRHEREIAAVMRGQLT